MKISISFGDGTERKIGSTDKSYENNLSIKSFIMLKGDAVKLPTSDASTVSYQDALRRYPDMIVGMVDYSQSINDFHYVRVTNRELNFFTSMSILKREFHRDENGEKHYQSVYSPVDPGFDFGPDGGVRYAKHSLVRDYNVRNNRNYQYLLLLMDSEPSTSGAYEGNYEYNYQHRFDVETRWMGWTITELYPTDEEYVYTANHEDGWRFRYNLSAGETRQDIVKTQQDNLSPYPVFSHGPKKSLSGNVTCLLGRDVVPYNYDVNTGKNIGGYQEKLLNNEDPSSNASLDMLEKWRDMCYSGNPKLLRDQKGNAYIIQITENSNETNEAWDKMPELISFSWVQIGDAQKYQIREVR